MILSPAEFQIWTIIIAAGTAGVILLSAGFVLWQARLLRQQIRFQVLVEIKNINRELLMLGFDDPSLFRIISGKARDSEKARRYLQLWINQVDLIYHAKRNGLLSKEFVQALEVDIRSFFATKGVEDFWGEVSRYYAPGLREYVDQLLNPERRDERPLDQGKDVVPVVLD